MRGNSCAQRHTGRARSSRHGNLNVVMAVFPSSFVARVLNAEHRGISPWTVREVCGIDTLVARSAHRRLDPHTGITESRLAPAAAHRKLSANTVELAVRYVRNRVSNYSPLTKGGYRGGPGRGDPAGLGRKITPPYPPFARGGRIRNLHRDSRLELIQRYCAQRLLTLARPRARESARTHVLAFLACRATIMHSSAMQQIKSGYVPQIRNRPGEAGVD